MNYPTFQTATASALPPHPLKHVKYTQGMVLGVDDFEQEHVYLSHADQRLARQAIGYGTVGGLHVALGPKDGDIEVSVSPGVAVNPRGQFIHVAPRQCAKLGAWLGLTETQKRLTELGLNTTTALTAYVILCYRDCPVDDLPVPGEPCRCDSETMAPSRVLADFRLELSLRRPPQREEEIVRQFVEWLRGIEVADESPPADLQAFLQAIRDAFAGLDSPPQSPPEFFFESPPPELRIPRAEVCEWMRAAMRLWVTELRPRWQAQCAPQKFCGCIGPCGCPGTDAEPEEMACECVLLAEIGLTRSGATVTDATLNEEHRPFLVHLRMLQELLLCGPCTCSTREAPAMRGPLGGDVTGEFDATVVEGIQGFPVEMDSPPAGGTVLGFDGSIWHLASLPSLPAVPEPALQVPELDAGNGSKGLSPRYALEDHVHPAQKITGNFVEHPEAGRYAIVAAGILSPTGKTVRPSYNGLKVFKVPTPENPTMVLTFKNYTFPKEHTYIVKGTSLGGKPTLFHVLKFTEEGFEVEFSNEGKTAFMIEVSQFGKLD